MSESKTYTIEQFVGDVKKVFASTKDPRAQAGTIAKQMEALLVSPGLYDRFTQNTGQAAFFLPGEFHMTGPAGGGPSRIIRLEAQKLDRVPRHSYKSKGASVALVVA